MNGSAPEEEFISEIIEMQDFLRDEGLGKLPVYFTEFGWTSSENDWQKAVDSRTRARYCARSLILCTARDIKALVYFAGRFQEPEDVEHYWMVRSNYTPYPTLSAYATAARELSDIPNGGAFFRLAPDAFLCSFLRRGKTLWVLWTSDDAERRVTLPETPISVRSMTGKKLTPSAELTLTPSPLYVEFEDPKLAVPIENAETGKTVETFPGSEIPLLGTPVLNIVQTENGSARFSDNASVGNYTILIRTEDGCLIARRVVVTEPFEIAWKDFVWDGKSETMTLRFSFRNHTNAISSGGARIGTESSAAPVPFEVPARQERVVSLPLSVQTGVRQTNCVTFEIQAPIHRTREIPFDVTPTAIPYYSNAESNEKREPENSADFKADWSAIPAIPVAQWGRPGDVRERDKAEIPAEIQAFATQAGIHLRITVHDQQHVQKYGSWSFMNAEDSIKLGFDLDAGKPWEFNNIRFGYNGHRCVEYAFSQTTPDPKTGKRQNQWWTTRSWLETIKSGPAFHLTPQTNIVRDEIQKTTTYEILIRWKDLEATEPPEEGTVLGFSLVIYDKNPETSRKMLRFGLGPDGGSPLDYGRITLVKP